MDIKKMAEQMIDSSWELVKTDEKEKANYEYFLRAQLEAAEAVIEEINKRLAESVKG
jgi:hypothetical protein